MRSVGWIMSHPWIRRSCRHGLSKAIRTRHTKQASRRISTQSPYLQISPEIRQALSDRTPLVALETTIYTHGIPVPQNLELALHLERLVRDNGAVPATIGVLNGIARVGFKHTELTELLDPGNASRTHKLSRRDLNFALGLRSPDGKPLNGGTTVAATMLLAHLAGVRVFATGGLGGVHRGAESTFDISADLTELGRTPVAVISSGVKAFLDLPKTLEVLETQGVGVATFADGRSGGVDFPSFYTRDSGIPSPRILRDESEAAEVLNAHFSLGLQSGILLANPIPEQFSLPKEIMDVAIETALQQAAEAGKKGAEATPFILARIKEITGEGSLRANWALVEANVIRGARVAVELARVGKGQGRLAHAMAATERSTPVTRAVPERIPSRELDSPQTQGSAPPTLSTTGPSTKPSIFVAGSLALDLSCNYQPTNPSQVHPTPQTSNPAEITQSLGGVGSNIARAAHLLVAEVRLCSAVGDDIAGQTAVRLLGEASNPGLDTSGIAIVKGAKTAQYVAFNDARKDLVMSMADMRLFEDLAMEPKSTVRRETENSRTAGARNIAAALESIWLPQLKEARPKCLVLDANWAPSHLSRWLEAGRQCGAHITYEPVSVEKSTRIFHLPSPSSSSSRQPTSTSQNTKPLTLPTYPNPLINLSTPNAAELAALHSRAQSQGYFDRQDWWHIIDAFGLPSTGSRVALVQLTSPELVDQGIPQQALQLLPFIPCLCVTLGAEGVLVAQILPQSDERLRRAEYVPYVLGRNGRELDEEDGQAVGGVYMRLFPPQGAFGVGDGQGEVVSVNGAGDTFTGALVAGLARDSEAADGRKIEVEDVVDFAQKAAGLTLRSEESVSPYLSRLRDTI